MVKARNMTKKYFINTHCFGKSVMKLTSIIPFISKDMGF